MTSKVNTIQDEIHRSMTGEERLELAIDMSLAARQLAISRLRSIHPDWSDAEIIAELLRYAMLPGSLPWSCDE